MQAKETRFRVTVLQGLRQLTLPRLLSETELLTRTCMGKPLGRIIGIKAVDLPEHEYIACRDVWGAFCGVCGRSKH